MNFVQNKLEKVDQFLNDHPKVKFILPQALLVIFVIFVISYFSFNASTNLASRGTLYYSGLYAGTTDCVGVHEGQPAIMDFKQTNKPKRTDWIDDYFLQLCAYANAHNNMFDTNIQRGVILMCSKDYQYQEWILEGEAFDYYNNIW